jgi:hypothetical protein
VSDIPEFDQIIALSSQDACASFAELRWPRLCGVRLIAGMNPKRPYLLSILVVLAFAVSALAQGNLDLQPNDTMQTVLQRQVGQSVELRMKSGEKLGGKLEKVTDKVVHLTQLTGAEYFDAVVVIDDVAAVVVRAKK